MKSRRIVVLVLMVVVFVFMVGCETMSRPVESYSARVEFKHECQRRQWTAVQMVELRAFTLKESPRLWETIVKLQTECRVREVALKNLREEMRSFGRDPDSDVDCVRVQKACDDLEATIDSVFIRLEEAYIAYKKFEATPGEIGYSKMAKKALEEGIQEAELAERRYRDMSKIK